MYNCKSLCYDLVCLRSTNCKLHNPSFAQERYSNRSPKEDIFMPFSLIKGTFHVAGYSPDGDSIRFQADDKSLWAKLSGPPAKLNAREHTQLRFEAIDTLETHYANFH